MSKSRGTRYVETTWEAWTYDVWGNAKDGYDVNDRSCLDRAYPMRLRVETHNVGTPHEFDSAHPSDSQIQRCFGVRCAIETDGDDRVVYVTRARDGYPLGEFCSSHESLSPIRQNAAEAN